MSVESAGFQLSIAGGPEVQKVIQGVELAVNNLVKTLGTVGTQTRTAFAGLDQGTQSLQRLDALSTSVTQKSIQSFDALTNSVRQIGPEIDAPVTKFQSFTNTLNQVGPAVLKNATSFGVFSASMFGVVNAIDTLRQRELSLGQQRVQTQQAVVTLQNAEDQLARARLNTNTTSGQIEVIEQKIETARNRVGLENEKLAFQENELNQARLQFATQIIPQILAATGAGVQSFVALNTALASSGGIVGVLSKTFGGLGVSLGLTTASATAASGAFSIYSKSAIAGAVATDRLSLSVRLLNLAFGPIGIAIAAVTGFITAFVTNLGGTRDFVNQLGVAWGQLIPQLKGGLEVLGQVGEAIVETFNPTTIDTSQTAQAFDALITELDAKSQDTLTIIKEFKNEFVGEIDFLSSTQFSDPLRNAADILKTVGVKINNALQEIGKLDKQADVTGLARGVTKELEALINNLEKAGVDIGTTGQVIRDKIKSILIDKTPGGEEVFFVNVDELESLIDLVKQKAPLLVAPLEQALINTKVTIGDFIPAIEELGKALGAIGQSDIVSSQNIEDVLNKITTAFGDQLPSTLQGIQVGFQQADQAAFDLFTTLTQNIDGSIPKLTELRQGVELAFAQFKDNPFAQRVLQTLLDLIDGNIEGLTDLAEKRKEEIALMEETNQKAEEEINLIKERVAVFVGEQKARTINTDLAKEIIGIEEERIGQIQSQIDSLQKLGLQLGINNETLAMFRLEQDATITSAQDMLIVLQSLILQEGNFLTVLTDTNEQLIVTNQGTIEGALRLNDWAKGVITASASTEKFTALLLENVDVLINKLPNGLVEVSKLLVNTLIPSFEQFSKIPFDLTAEDGKEQFKEFAKGLGLDKDLDKKIKLAAELELDVNQELDKVQRLITGSLLLLRFSSEVEFDQADATQIVNEIQDKIQNAMESDSDLETIFKPLLDTIDAVLADGTVTFEELTEVIRNFIAVADPEDIKAIQTVMAALGIDITSIGTASTKLDDATPHVDNLTSSLENLSKIDLTKLFASLDASQKDSLSVIRNLDSAPGDVENAKSNILSTGRQKSTIFGILGGDINILSEAIDNLADKEVTLPDPDTTAFEEKIQNATLLVDNLSFLLTGESALQGQGVGAEGVRGGGNGGAGGAGGLQKEITIPAPDNQAFIEAINLALASVSALLFALTGQQISIEGTNNQGEGTGGILQEIVIPAPDVQAFVEAIQVAIDAVNVLLIALTGQGIGEGEQGGGGGGGILAEVIIPPPDFTQFAEAFTTATELVVLFQTLVNEMELIIPEPDLSEYESAMDDALTVLEDFIDQVNNADLVLPAADISDFEDSMNEAIDLLNEIIDLLDEIDGMKVTAVVEIQRKLSGSSSGDQHGGAEIIDKDTFVRAGEGNKEELHFFFPLSRQNASHAAPEFRLPNLEDLVRPINVTNMANADLSPRVIQTTSGAGAPSPVINVAPIIPVNISIDLTDEIRKLIRIPNAGPRVGEILSI